MSQTDFFLDKTVIVSGGSQGIGYEIANQFSRCGATVAIIDILAPPDDLKAYWFKCDLSNEDEVAEVYSKITEQLSVVDFLINTARGPRGNRTLQESGQSLQASLDVGLKSAMILSQCFIKDAQHNLSERSIVNISSISGHRVSGESAAYHIIKSGLDSLTRYLAVQGGKRNVRVNGIAPGFIVSNKHVERFESEDNQVYRERAINAHVLPRVGTPLDVANSALFLCSEQAGFITGQTLIVDGGLGLRDGWHQVTSM